MEGYSESSQVQLIKNLSEALTNNSVLDKAVFELVEFGVIDPWIGVLSRSIANGENVDQCGYCGEMKVIAGQYEFNGEQYCSECYEEEESN